MNRKYMPLTLIVFLPFYGTVHTIESQAGKSVSVNRQRFWNQSQGTAPFWRSQATHQCLPLTPPQSPLAWPAVKEGPPSHRPRLVEETTLLTPTLHPATFLCICHISSVFPLLFLSHPSPQLPLATSPIIRWYFTEPTVVISFPAWQRLHGIWVTAQALD